jgi:hypothetical protein
MLIYLAFALSGVLAWMVYERRTRQPAAPNQVLRFQGGGTYEFPVLGASRYRPVLEKIYASAAQDTTGRIVEALLVLEKSDQNVRVEIRGYTVGYLAPDLALEYRRRLVEAGHQNARATCRARITARVGTLECTDFGIRLDLPPSR